MTNKPDKWKRIRSERVGDHRVFTVREDFCVNSATDVEASFFVIECPDWANIIPITPSGEVVLIEQFRQGIEEITLEIPGGMIDGEELPIAAVKRELTEETGYSSDEIIEIGRSRPNPAIQNNWMHHFVAKNCRFTGDTNFDDHESIVTRLVPFEDIAELIKSEAITHSLVLAAFQHLLIRNGNGGLV